MTFYSYLKEFTETYQAHYRDDPALREAYCTRVQSLSLIHI